MQNFRHLRVWTAARSLTLQTYLLTRKFPSEERYGLTSQMRRAAMSICANIAEGCGRGSPGELRTFLRYAFGSACELQCHVILASDLNLLDQTGYLESTAAVRDVKRMLAGLLRKVGV